jgi:CHAT domain-containing protein
MPKRELYKIEFPTSSIQEPNTVEDILHTLKQSNGYLSSPMSNEELIVPVSINDKTSHNYSLTPRKQHKKRKTHKTYKVYKKQKSSSNKTKSNQKIKYQRL